MGLDDVKNEILEEAEQEAEEIKEDAENRKEEILEEAEREAERLRDEADEEIQEEKEALEKKAVSNANMEGRKRKLNTKEKALGKAFEQFQEHLEDLSDSDKEAMINRAIDDANFDVGLVKGSEEFEDFIDEDFEASDVNGFVLVSENGERQLNFSYSKIADDFREKYRKDVADTLFR